MKRAEWGLQAHDARNDQIGVALFVELPTALSRESRAKQGERVI